MRRTIIALAVLAGLAACERAPVAAPPPTVDDAEAGQHLIKGQELPILRSPQVQTEDTVTLKVTVDAAGRVTTAVATDGPAGVRGAAEKAALDLRYRPFLIGGRAQPVTFTAYVDAYPPELLPSRHVAFPAGDPSTVRIRLERGGCFGTCPIYTVEIGGGGQVTYWGAAYVAIVGEHHAKISPAAVADLVERFRRADFFSLQDAYTARITDSATQKVAIKVGGREKWVTDYVGLAVGMPTAVTRLETAIDAVAGTARWVKADERTISALKAEEWNFTSRDAGRSLIWNAGQGSEPLARALLDAGAPLAPEPERDRMMLLGRSALEEALVHDRVSLARAMIARGAIRLGGPDAAERALIAAASSGHADVVAEMLTHHPDVNRMIDGQSALIAAVAFRYMRMNDQHSTADLARLLLQSGADPNLRGDQGETALHLARDAETVRLLVKAGARLETRDEMDRTPLLAVTDEEAAIALVDAGADVHARSGGSDIAEEARRSDWKKLSARLSHR